MTWRDWFYIVSLVVVLSMIVAQMIRNKDIGFTKKDLTTPYFWSMTLVIVWFPQIFIVTILINFIISPKWTLKFLKDTFNLKPVRR